MKIKTQILTTLCALAFATSGYASSSWCMANPHLDEYSKASDIVAAEGYPTAANTYALFDLNANANISVDANLNIGFIKPADYSVTFDFSTSTNYWITFETSLVSANYPDKAFVMNFTNTGSGSGSITINSSFTLGQTNGSDGYEWNSSTLKGTITAKSTFSILTGAKMNASNLTARGAFSNAGTFTVKKLNVSNGSNSATTFANSGTMNATDIYLNNSSTFTNSGTLNNITDTKLTIYGSSAEFTNTGSISTAAFKIENGVTFSNSGTITAAGQVDINGILNHTSGLISNTQTTLVNAGGTLNLSATLQTNWFTFNGGTVRINAGSITGPTVTSLKADSTLILATDASLGISFNDNKTLSAHTNGNSLTITSLGSLSGKLDIYIDNGSTWEDDAIKFVLAKSDENENKISSILGDVYVNNNKVTDEYALIYKNDGYYLNTVAVPEPAQWAVIFGVIALGFAMYRRRK